MPRPFLTTAQARRLLERFHSSHLTQTAFCRKYAVSPSLFGYWKSRLHSPVPSVLPPFQEVHIPASPIPHCPCTLTLPTGAKIDFPSSQLLAVITVLNEERSRC